LTLVLMGAFLVGLAIEPIASCKARLPTTELQSQPQF
jgi:hypothetical protein